MRLDGFADIFAGLSVSDGIAAIVAAGTVIAGVEFTGWCVDKVAGFFSDDEEWVSVDGICDMCGNDAPSGAAFCAECEADYNGFLDRQEASRNHDYDEED